MAVKRTLIVRHGETDYNVQARIQGHLNVALNDHGREQAQALATYLADAPIGAIYSSDLVRAYETAEPLAKLKGLPIHADERLREINLGVFQGYSGSELRRSPQYAEAYERWRADASYIVPGGESFDQLGERTQAAWEEIIQKETVETVLIVTHGGNVRALLSRLFPHYDLPRIANTGITELSKDENQWHLGFLSETPHL
ncbi:histidine phosphatase family protein [Phototrophicus methaneseepsis]|uniref:Histidine phosphatase family protein n=1 Tax=Phototrophicus methaneseepsis TaxID=2710758 RepID=A0A7S8E715_9CHLR|nr:histidine phosphatase family protein [Phototrophicus methaneseepsis]QPC81561.1 histidine phosphatase family protein [Phototrophicus methaneseepsis]